MMTEYPTLNATNAKMRATSGDYSSSSGSSLAGGVYPYLDSLNGITHANDSYCPSTANLLPMTGSQHQGQYHKYGVFFLNVCLYINSCNLVFFILDYIEIE